MPSTIAVTSANEYQSSKSGLVFTLFGENGGVEERGARKEVAKAEGQMMPAGVLRVRGGAFGSRVCQT
jgi:hypothetical protein